MLSGPRGGQEPIHLISERGVWGGHGARQRLYLQWPEWCGRLYSSPDLDRSWKQVTAGCVGGSTRVHRVSGNLLVARGDKMTATGPRAWSPRDGARCSVIRGKPTSPHSSLTKPGPRTPWANNWPRKGTVHEGSGQTRVTSPVSCLGPGSAGGGGRSAGRSRPPRVGMGDSTRSGF